MKGTNCRGASVFAGQQRVKLGTWVCPSGNSVDAYLDQDATGRYHAWLFWDEPPPLRPEDRVCQIPPAKPVA